MGAALDKQALLAELKEHFKGELDKSTKRAQDAATAATHEENRPENDKDMRSTEASYLARGQAERVNELEQTLVKLGSMTVRDFADGDGIQVSAVVDVALENAASKPTETRYFLVNGGGGVRLSSNVLSLAINSPLGKVLLGCEVGDDAEVVTPQGTKSYAIVRVR